MPDLPHSSQTVRPRRLLDQVRDAVRVRHYSYRTEQAYVGWVRRFVVFHAKRHPAEMGVAEIRRFLTALAVDRQVSASTQNQALAALLFLYRDVLGCDPGLIDDVVRAKRPQRLPVVLTRREVDALLACLEGAMWLLAVLLYGGGLRVIEALRLRVHDLDFERGEILVRHGKGGKDRVTVLPGITAAPLAAHLDRVRSRHSADIAAGSARCGCPMRWRASIRTPGANGDGSGSFRRLGSAPIPDSVCRRAIICTRAPCRRRFTPPLAAPACPSPSGRIPCGTASPPIFSRMGTTSAPYRSYSATAT